MRRSADRSEQIVYARLLDFGVRAGLVALIGTFAIYLSGAATPLVDMERLPEYWVLPVEQYLARTGLERGWSWVRWIGHGDVLGLAGVALLSGVTLACYARILTIFARRGERALALICTLEIAVLGLAASGFLQVGAH